MSRWPETPSCDEIQEHLEAYLDGKLSESAMARTRSHLDGCPECSAQAHLACEIHKELRALPEFDAPAPALQRILDQTVRSESPKVSRVTFWDRWPRPAWAALAAAALVLALGVTVLHEESPPPEVPNGAAIAQATAEARYALARTGLLTRKAGVVIRDKALRDQIAAPTTRGLSQALGNPKKESSGVSLQGVNDV